MVLRSNITVTIHNDSPEPLKYRSTLALWLRLLEMLGRRIASSYWLREGCRNATTASYAWVLQMHPKPDLWSLTCSGP